MQQSSKNQVFLREIKSFVKREGRLTKGQQRALDVLFPQYGRSLSDGVLDIDGAIVEIGFGNGASLAEMAVAEPEQRFIGIEVHRPGVGAFLMSVEQQDLDNVFVYQEDAIEVLKQCIPDDSLSRVQLFFPDPWPKKKHHKRRIVQPTFVELVAKKLKCGGVLHLATDWQPYAEHMLEVLQASEQFANLSKTNDYAPKPAYRPKTKFEARGERLGHGVWDLLFQKN